LDLRKGRLDLRKGRLDLRKGRLDLRKGRLDLSMVWLIYFFKPKILFRLDLENELEYIKTIGFSFYSN
jgi:hypothetical protein